MYFDFDFQQVKKKKTIQDHYNAEMSLCIDSTARTTFNSCNSSLMLTNLKRTNTREATLTFSWQKIINKIITKL